MAGPREDIDLILQVCLEKIQSGEATLDGVLDQYPDLAEELRPPLESALWFRMRKATLDPRPGFVSASRRRVVDQIQYELVVEARPVHTRGVMALGQFIQSIGTQRRLAFQLAVILVLVLGMVMGSAGAARAAQDSLPGDMFYGVKISLEKAALGLAGDETASAELHIRFAQRRLEEMQALIAENRVEDLSVVVASYEEHVNQAIRDMIAVRSEDQGQANVLAASLQLIMQDKVAIFQRLAETASEEAGEQIERVLLVSAGVVGLLEKNVADIPLPAIVIDTPTAVLSPTPGLTQEAIVATLAPAATPTPIPLPSATLGVTAVVSEPTITELTHTATPTMTVTIVASEGEEELNPSKTPKPTKTPKPDKEEKDKKDKKKDLPEPPRRPVDPPNER